MGDGGRIGEASQARDEHHGGEGGGVRFHGFLVAAT
jgi:hypothetical protein